MKLSPSKLNKFRECPLLFWLAHHHKIDLPRGAFPSLPGGMDRVLKVYYDDNRTKGALPSELKDYVSADTFLFADQDKIKKWRSWRTSDLEVEVGPGRIVSGAIDDLLHNAKSGLVSVLDYKTRGAAPVPGDTEKYYGLQADTYDFMLSKCGFPTTGRGFFAYYWPDGNASYAGRMNFGFHSSTVEVETNWRRAFEMAVKAFDCLDGPMPELKFGDEISNFLLKALDQLGYKKTAAQAREMAGT